MSKTKKRLFHVSDDWKESISVSRSELQEGFESGEHTLQSLVWTKGMNNWLPLSDSHWKKFDIGVSYLPPPLPKSKGCMDCRIIDTELRIITPKLPRVHKRLDKYLRDIGRLDVYKYHKKVSKSLNFWDLEKNEDFDTIISESIDYLMENYFTCVNCLHNPPLTEEEAARRQAFLEDQNKSDEADKVNVKKNNGISDYISVSKESNKFRSKTGSNMTFAQGATAGFIANQIRETKEDVNDIQEDVADIQSEVSDNPGVDFSGFF